MGDGKHVILYIDDDQDYLDNLRVILESAGYEMIEARTAEEGLKLYESSRPDLVIVDLMMEEIDSGTRFVREMKALGDPVPIFLLSSVGDHFSATADYGELGLDGLFQKPVDAETILYVLASKLGV